jgi:hypothetical protein
MQDTVFKSFDHPAVWKATDFNSKDNFSIDLSTRQVDALEAETAAYKKSGGDHQA